jgi:hypothetical protein
MFHLRLYINGELEGEFVSPHHLETRLEELASDYPDADLDQPVENFDMNVWIPGYWDNQVEVAE